MYQANEIEEFMSRASLYLKTKYSCMVTGSVFVLVVHPKFQSVLKI
jgi:hypothetical protein